MVKWVKVHEHPGFLLLRSTIEVSNWQTGSEAELLQHALRLSELEVAWEYAELAVQGPMDRENLQEPQLGGKSHGFNTGWWFGTMEFYFLHILGIVIPTD